MTEPVPRWIEDARIKERMHAQGLGLDMMLSVDRGSDAVVLRTTTRHLTRDEARELGQRLIEAALLAGERVDVGQDAPKSSEPLRVRDAEGDWFERVGPDDYRLERPSGADTRVRYTLEEIYAIGAPMVTEY